MLIYGLISNTIDRRLQYPSFLTELPSPRLRIAKTRNHRTMTRLRHHRLGLGLLLLHRLLLYHLHLHRLLPPQRLDLPRQPRMVSQLLHSNPALGVYFQALLQYVYTGFSECFFEGRVYFELAGLDGFDDIVIVIAFEG